MLVFLYANKKAPCVKGRYGCCATAKKGVKDYVSFVTAVLNYILNQPYRFWSNMPLLRCGRILPYITIAINITYNSANIVGIAQVLVFSAYELVDQW